MARRTNDAAASPDTRPRGRGNIVYVGLWLIAGIAATTYLGMLAFGKTDLLAHHIGAEELRSPDRLALRRGNEAPIGSAASDRLNRIDGQIGTLKAEVSALEAGMSQLANAQDTTSSRVRALEAWQGSIIAADGSPILADTENRRSSSAARPAAATAAERTAARLEDPAAIEGTTLDGVTRTPPPPAASANVARPTPQPSAGGSGTSSGTGSDDATLAALLAGDPAALAAVSGRASPTGRPGTTTIPPATNAALVTAPLPEAEPAAPPSAPAIVPIPGQRTFGVALGSGESVDALRLKWALLNERHRDLIGTLAPRFVRTGAGGQAGFRLIAGPLPSSREARELCTQLNAYYVQCDTSAFTGRVL
ncbi:MAG: hypothetical protein AAFQ35_01185 [Pseudomonadota bacterium]